MEKGYQDEVDRYGDLMDAAIRKSEAAKAELASLGGTGTKPTSTTSHSSKKGVEVAAAGSLGDLEKQLSDLQKKYKDGLITLSPEEYQKQVKALEE